jgi:hypothetical protein
MNVSMTRPRILRLLRIAASVVCLILCGLLVALWERSYYPPSLRLQILSMNRPPYFASLDIASWKGVVSLSYKPPQLKLEVQCLLLLLLFGTLAGLPWVQRSRRFSLRAFLIIMMLIAVMLGIGVGMR